MNIFILTVHFHRRKKIIIKKFKKFTDHEKLNFHNLRLMKINLLKQTETKLHECD